jgi:hypothetical protein
MADDLGNRAPEDGKRISLSEDWEVRYWTKALGISEDRLREVIAEVGHMAEDVRRALDQAQ